MYKLFRFISLGLLFLVLNSYTDKSTAKQPVTSVDGFAWSMLTFDYEAFKAEWYVSSSERTKRANELMGYYMDEYVPEEERMQHIMMIQRTILANKWYRDITFEQARMTDQFVHFLFETESPLNFEKTDIGYTVGIDCMDALIQQSYKNKAKILPHIKKGRRFNSNLGIECDQEQYYATKDYYKSSLEARDSIRKRITEMHINNYNKGLYPCYYTYMILSPTEVNTLKSELALIKKQKSVSNNADCALNAFYTTVAEAADNNKGIFLYTTD